MGYDQKKQGTKLLIGTVEVDETYVGGKPRYRHSGGTGRGTTKAPVVAMVQRGGDVRFRYMERITAGNLEAAIAANASVSARLITDELNAYRGVGRAFSGGHHTVTHSQREYSRGDVHSNTVESVFSLLKRGVMGTFHSISKKHLPNYLNEFEFRWNTRKADDGERVSRVIRAVEGKRLQYRESVDNPPYVVGAQTGQADAPFD
jgi:transposase-like protein